MRRDDFLEQATAAAEMSSVKSGFPKGIAVAQAALESDFGNSMLSKAANNYFGIKAHGKHPVFQFRTCEFGEKGEQQVVARFAGYKDMQECFDCRDRQIINGNLYAEARRASPDAERFARELAKHWATDPKYAEKLLAVYRENQLDELDLR